MGVVSTIDIKNKRNNRGVIMKNKALSFLSLIISFLLVFSILSPVFVFADSTNASSYDKKISFSDNSGSITSGNIGTLMGGDAKGYKNGNIEYSTNGELSIIIKGEKKPVLKVSQTEIEINSSVFKNYSNNKDLTKAMRLFVDALSKTEANPDVKQEIMQNIQDADTSISSVMLPLIFESTKGDMYQAYKITSPFLELLSIVLGVGAVILILLLLFSTVMDLAYIGLPVWREAQQNKNGNNGKNPFGVSYEALTTVKEIEKGLGGGDGGYRNAYLLYFRRRALTYIILAICIMYLICGGLSGIIGFVLSLVSGITG